MRMCLPSSVLWLFVVACAGSPAGDATAAGAATGAGAPTAPTPTLPPPVDGGAATAAPDAAGAGAAGAGAARADAAGAAASPASDRGARNSCRVGQWRDVAADGVCRDDPDEGPSTCGHRMIHRKGTTCDCAASDLRCVIHCGLTARWQTPAPAQERADCRAKCAADRPWACLKLGLAELKAGSHAHGVAITHLDRACALGVGSGCAKLLSRTLDSDALAAAAPTLRPWLERSCDQSQHEHRACTGLAMVLEHGWGVAIDRPRAQRLYERACTRATKSCGGKLCWFAEKACEGATRLRP